MGRSTAEKSSLTDVGRVFTELSAYLMGSDDETGRRFGRWPIELLAGPERQTRRRLGHGRWPRSGPNRHETVLRSAIGHGAVLGQRTAVRHRTVVGHDGGGGGRRRARLRIGEPRRRIRSVRLLSQDTSS